MQPPEDMLNSISENENEPVYELPYKYEQSPDLITPRRKICDNKAFRK